jgi:hypothetical protein
MYVDSTGTEIERFAYVTIPALGPGMPFVFDDDNMMWVVTVDPSTFVATAAAYSTPFAVTSYTGTNCTGDAVISYSGQPRNVPFLSGDQTIRVFPATAPSQHGIQSQNFFGTCQVVTTVVTGYLASETVPATALTPPTLTWTGPIEARWVD